MIKLITSSNYIINMIKKIIIINSNLKPYTTYLIFLIILNNPARYNNRLRLINLEIIYP